MTPIYAILRHPGKYNRHFLLIKTSGCTSQDGVNWRQRVKFLRTKTSNRVYDLMKKRGQHAGYH